MKTLGQHIRELRERQDLSLREFAKRLGELSAAFVSDVELGRRFPSDKVLAKMAQVLGVAVDELKSHDQRPPVDEIKQRAASDPAFGFALRRISELTSEQINDLIKKVDPQKKQ